MIKTFVGVLYFMHVRAELLAMLDINFEKKFLDTINFAGISSRS